MTGNIPTGSRLAMYRNFALVVAAVFALHMLSTLMYAGLEFDESFNLQVPLNLYLYGEYQTWYNGFHKFHYLITTGPTVFFPAYALFVAGSSTSYMLARLVTFSFSILFIILLYREFFSREDSAKGAAFGGAVLVMVFMVPEFALLSVRVLGEIPGIALITASYRLLASDSDNRIFGAGMLLALAVLSKLIFLIALVPAVLVIAMDAAAPGALQRGMARLGLFFAGLAIPLACWQTFRMSSLGVEGYLESWKMQSRFLESMTAGSPDNSMVGRALSVFGARVGKLLAETGLSGVLGYLFIALLAASVAVALYAYIRDRGLDRFHILVLLFGLAHTGWWAMLNIVDYYRHLFPGLVMLIAGIGLTLYGVYRSGTKLSKPAAALFTALFVLFTVSGLGRVSRGLPDAFTFSPSEEAVAQAAYAEKVAQMAGQGYVFYGYEWLQVPELSYLAKVQFFSVYDNRSLGYLAKHPGVLIVSRYNFEKDRAMSLDALSDFTDIGPNRLADAGFPDETRYVFAPIVKVTERRIVPASTTESAGKGR